MVERLKLDVLSEEMRVVLDRVNRKRLELVKHVLQKAELDTKLSDDEVMGYLQDVAPSLKFAELSAQRWELLSRAIDKDLFDLLEMNGELEMEVFIKLCDNEDYEGRLSFGERQAELDIGTCANFVSGLRATVLTLTILGLETKGYGGNMLQVSDAMMAGVVAYVSERAERYGLVIPKEWQVESSRGELMAVLREQESMRKENFDQMHEELTADIPEESAKHMLEFAEGVEKDSVMDLVGIYPTPESMAEEILEPAKLAAILQSSTNAPLQ